MTKSAGALLGAIIAILGCALIHIFICFVQWNFTLDLQDIRMLIVMAFVGAVWGIVVAFCTD